MNRIKLSIVVPCYNVENFIEKCIESLINQKYIENIEILLINDGSTDNTEKKIKKYLKNKHNLIYFYKKNEGLSKTRNFGIENSKGKYIMFLDGDDYLEKEFSEIVIPTIDKEFDLINISHRQVLLNKENNKAKTLKSFSLKKQTLNLNDFIFNSFLTSACTKIIKKEIIQSNKIYFSDAKWYEDVNFVLKIAVKSNRIINISENLYNYVQRNNSITKTYNEKILDIFYIIDDVLDFFEKNEIVLREKMKSYLIFEYCLNHHYSRLIRTEKNLKNKILEQTIEYLNNKKFKDPLFKYLYIDMNYLNGIIGRIYFKILSKLKKGL